ncbi:MAG TPA: SUKH-3 domain-containing protein [Puia sp.]
MFQEVDFLEAFDGLTIRFPNLKNGINDDITLDFDKADELVYPERIHEDYQPRIGKKSCIIGTAYREHYVLIMDEDGMVYGGYDNYLVKIGDSGIDALEAIITNRKSIEIGNR